MDNVQSFTVTNGEIMFIFNSRFHGIIGRYVRHVKNGEWIIDDDGDMWYRDLDISERRGIFRAVVKFGLFDLDESTFEIGISNVTNHESQNDDTDTVTDTVTVIAKSSNIIESHYNYYDYYDRTNVLAPTTLDLERIRLSINDKDNVFQACKDRDTGAIVGFMRTNIHSAMCNDCGSCIISAYRWHCKECENYDLCEKCHDAGVHISSHGMIKCGTWDFDNTPLSDE